MQSTGILLLVEVGFIVLNFVLAEFGGLNINWVLLVDIALGIGVNMTLNHMIARFGRELGEHEVMQKP